jgi:hypothetical protein
MKLMIVVAFGLLLFFLFRLLAGLSGRLALSRNVRVQVERLFPVVEFMVWLVFLFWALFYLFEDKTYFPYMVYSLVVVLVLLFAWFVLKDIFAGLVFRSQYRHSPGQGISMHGISGKIISLGITHMKIESGGSIIRIPYGKLSDETVYESQDADYNRSIFRVAVPKPASVDESMDHIRFVLFNSPWIFPRAEPVIVLSDEDEKDYFFDISLNIMDEKQRRRIDIYLKRWITDGERWTPGDG